MTIARVRSLWTGPAVVGGGLTDLYFFSETSGEGAMADAVFNFWTDLAGAFNSANTVAVQADVYNLDAGSGDVVNIVTLGDPPDPVVGTSSGDPLPVASQGLIRWRTSGVVANRVVRGRTFIPGCDEGANAGGRPTTSFRGFLESAAAALIDDAATQLQIWARPKRDKDTHEIIRAGSQHTVTSADAWSEWAVIRSRRD